MTLLLTFTNLGIFAAYMFVAFYIGPSFKFQRMRNQIAVSAFFLFCGLTHLELAVHTFSGNGISPAEMTSLHMSLIHIPQVLAAWVFVIGLYDELVRIPQKTGLPFNPTPSALLSPEKRIERAEMEIAQRDK